MEKRCPKCTFTVDRDEFCNKEGKMVYGYCRLCRTTIRNAKAKIAKRRKLVKEINTIDKDVAIQIRRRNVIKYIISSHNMFCYDCGYNDITGLTITGGLNKYINIFAAESTQDNWDIVMRNLHHIVVFCLNCQARYMVNNLNMKHLANSRPDRLPMPPID